MNFIYKGNINGYKENILLIEDNIFYFDGFDCGEILWKISKKGADYDKKEIDNGKYRFVCLIFKNSYIMISRDEKVVKKIDDIPFD